MVGCLSSGIQYELKIASILSKIKYKNQKLNMHQTTAAAGHDNDIMFTINEKSYGIECKNKGAFEGGGRVMKVNNGKLCVHDNSLINVLYGNYIPFNGNIPGFLGEDKTTKTWMDQKHIFSDEYIQVESTAISNYYKTKGSSYIQIEGKGLYHTGDDILELDVPLFQGSTRLRIRTTKHIDKKTGVPKDITVALVFKRSSLEKSLYCLETNLPKLMEVE